MKSLYDKLNEKRNDNVFYVVTGSDDTMHSVWVNKADADAECKKCNKEIGGSFFSVTIEDKSNFIEMTV